MFLLQTKFFVTENTIDVMMKEIAEQDPWVSKMLISACKSRQCAVTNQH